LADPIIWVDPVRAPGDRLMPHQKHVKKLLTLQTSQLKIVRISYGVDIARILNIL
jgi:hypothetical protein